MQIWLAWLRTGVIVDNKSVWPHPNPRRYRCGRFCVTTVY
jgi:hypothetical protein